MTKNEGESIVSDVSCFVMMAIFIVGLVVLGVKLKEVQVRDSADYSYANARQSVRRVQTTGMRGRILDRNGTVLADNRTTLQIVCHVSRFGRRTWRETEAAVSEAIGRVARVVGRPSAVSQGDIARHVNQRLARPLVVWRGLADEELARFAEHEREFPGFACTVDDERRYPFGNLAAHAIGYVGRDEVVTDAGDEKFNFRERELRGRGGLESYYDIFLRGVPGEDKVLVDARGFAIRSWTVVNPRRGPDLRLTIDVEIQRAAERELAGERGACVVMDPRNGEILAFASAPGYDLNRCVPRLSEAYYTELTNDVARPLLNRASGGSYAPGSTFKPVTALAALSQGVSPAETYDCCGVFELGSMHLHCSRTWGHGTLDMRQALMKSCNPYFCNLGVMTGTNALFQAARALGLGSRTGLDLGVDAAGVVPDAEWKARVYRERWYPGDVAQMSIGQGMLLVSPLQMARVTGGLAVGYLVNPHFKLDLPVERRLLPFRADALEAVRTGMRMVVAGDGGEAGTGRRGGEGVAVPVSGKTGTAEVGYGERRRKNTWFVAFAPTDRPRVAVAMVIENGQSGGGTTAPKVANVLKAVFGEAEGRVSHD